MTRELSTLTLVSSKKAQQNNVGSLQFNQPSAK
ncbi:hypothetical protein CCACVL1_21445 [Corchorus capsularis]|uniref:Uncharacterized protein n=1 Tax=Corchorus capsularis TaxID=210143 RepID=A0A1R3H5L4_COCAP|nr:hypothetical protein CCACVL1_21445 [Corchorus capsularis]